MKILTFFIPRSRDRPVRVLRRIRKVNAPGEACLHGPGHRIGFGVIALCLSINSAADAAEASGGSAPPQVAPVAAATSLPPASVTGNYDTGIGSSDAASEGSVRGELIESRPALRPAEVLEFVPGLVVTQHSGDGKANQYFLRGYNLDHGTDFATFVDGVPVNMPTNAHGQGYSDLNFLIPELVERIDYRKGPYFAENGDFSSAGSADILYRNRLDHDFGQFTVGSFGYKRALAAGSADLAGPTLLGAAELEEQDGPWTVRERLNKYNLLTRLASGDRGNGWSIDLIGYGAHWDSTDQVPLALIESGQLGRWDALDPSDGGDTGREVLSAEWHRHDESGYTKVAAYLESYRLQLWSNFTFFELRPTTGDQFEQRERRILTGGSVTHGWNQPLFGRDSTTEIGLQVRNDQIRVGLFNTEGRVPFDTVSDDRVGETEAGVYLQNTTAWTGWVRSLVGVRADAVSMRVDALTPAINSGDASAHRVSPKLSLIFGPWLKTEVFANFGRGFHSNDARGVTEKVDPTTQASTAPIPALVGSTGYELGLRTEAIHGLQSSLAIWRLDSASELVYAADSALGNTDPNGASRRYGVEWNNHWIAAPWLLFDADIAWTHARYAHDNDNDDIGHAIPNAVREVALVGVTVRDLGPWSGSLQTRYIGAYPLSQDGSLQAPSATVTYLRIERALFAGASASLDVLNLFNRKFYDIAYEQDYRASPTAPVVPDGITVHPGEPREFRLTLRYRL